MEKCKCGKCDGKGFLPEYRGISGGKCFSCNGTGEYETSCRTWFQINKVFWVKAKTEELAVKKAEQHYKKKGITKEVKITDMNIR